MAPHSAKLYGGTLNGTLSASARGNQVNIKETLQGVQINPLLKDLAETGIRFKDLQTTQSSLEEIFVSLVKRPQ